MEKLRYSLTLGSLLILMLFGLGGCAGLTLKAEPVDYAVLRATQLTPTNPNAPVILNAAAVTRGKFGTILRIYIEAKDPNGDMHEIATTVNQVGYGHYPTDMIYLKPEYRGYFKGYIQWNTFSSRASDLPEWNYVTVNVAVIDRAGNISNEFEFTFSFETGTGPVPPPPEVFQGPLPRLGNVSIDLFNPLDGASAGARED